MAEAHEVTGDVVATLNIVRENDIVFGLIQLADHVVAEDDERDTLLGKQSEQVGRIGASQNRAAYDIPALHHVRRTQFLSGNLQGVVR